MNKKIFLLLPLLALACGVSRSAFLVLPTERIPSPTAEAAQIMPQVTRTHASTHVCTVSVENLHLRDQPGVNGVVIGWLKLGDVLTVLPDPPVDDWIRVRRGEAVGWINSNYCERKNP